MSSGGQSPPTLDAIITFAEPRDRLERSSPGYGPGASPSTLAGQGTAATPSR